MRTALFILGLGAWFLGIFIAALHVHFPGDAVLERARYELQEASDGDWAIDATSADLWRVSGIALDDLVLYKVERPKRRRRVRRRPLKGEDGAAEPEDETLSRPAHQFIKLDELRMRVALLPLLSGDRRVNFDGDALKGSFDGSAGKSGDRSMLRLDAEKLNLADLPLSGEDWQVQAAGLANLTADLELDSKSPRDSTGELRLDITGMAIRSAKAMGIELTPVSFTEAVLAVNIANGKAEITEGNFDGDILDASLSGHATLSKRELSRWRLRVKVKLELDDTLDQFARFSPKLKHARDDQGTYHLLCTGVLSRPICNADRAAAGTLRKNKRRGARRKQVRAVPNQDRDRAEDTQDDELEEMDRDARREARLERIRQRRKRLREERRERREARGDMDEMDVDSDQFDDRPNLRRPVLPRRFPQGGPPDPDEFEPEDGPMPPDMDEFDQLPPDEMPFDDDPAGMDEPY